MINAPQRTHHPSIRRVDAIDGVAVPVMMSGPETGRTIVMLDNAARNGGAYDEVRERLEVAMFRTVVIYRHEGLSPKAVVSVLDQLKVVGGVLVADAEGGELAWKVAAAHGDRFTGLVVVDCSHPAVPDVHGVVRDKRCPVVQLDTTVLVSTPAAHAAALACRRFIRGDFRLLDAAGRRRSAHFIGQLCTEIVVRAFSR